MTLQKAASHLGLFCLLICFSSENEITMKITPDSHKNESGLVQMRRMGKSIRHIWVKCCSYFRVEGEMLRQRLDHMLQKRLNVNIDTLIDFKITEPGHGKKCAMLYANNNGADQMRIQISAFVVF